MISRSDPPLPKKKKFTISASLNRVEQIVFSQLRQVFNGNYNYIQDLYYVITKRVCNLGGNDSIFFIWLEENELLQ